MRYRDYHHSSANGFSLIEMALVIVLMAILAGFAFQAILKSVSVYTTSSRDYLMVAQEGRIAMEKMIREIRETTPGRIIIGNETISFNKHTGTPQDSNLTVSFSKSGSKIVRNTTGGTFDLVDNISIFNPSQDAITDVVTIDFTLLKGATNIKMRSASLPRQVPTPTPAGGVPTPAGGVPTPTPNP